ncbi:MAG: DUF882 domain-containing protein [Deltaproteobacteria bacterium]|nr:DUF882 domain-containing protein [Deltaproteobacteria bacterium]
MSHRSRNAVFAATVGLLLACWMAASVTEAQTHRVRRGQNLTRIARRYGVTVEELREANGLGRRSRIREGQVLVLPGHEQEERSRRERRRGQRDETERRSWGRARRPGVASVFSFMTNRRATVRLVDARGRVPAPTLHKLERLFRHRGGDAKQVHPRLVRLLARVSDHFGGRTLEIISGYRPPGVGPTRHSRHHLGHAVDLRVRGVPNTALRDFCRTFDHVGVGYYPNSSFIHLDVRRSSTHWIDWSGPGERPRYGRRNPDEPLDASEPDDLPAEPDDGRPLESRPAPDEAPRDAPAPAAPPAASAPTAAGGTGGEG